MAVDTTYLNIKYKPLKFYFFTFLFSLVFTLAAAYVSNNPDMGLYRYLFVVATVLVPATMAMVMIYGSGNDALKKDFLSRLVNMRLIRPKYLLFCLLLMPVAVLLATAISLLLGQPASQFALSPGFSASWPAVMYLLIAIILAPVCEELGWRGYGVDSLAKKGRSLFVSTAIYAVLWDVWHWPLFLVNGYYHHDVLLASPLWALNFVIMVLPTAFLHNWIYYRSGRSIPVVILFHAVNNFSATLLQTEQFTKCIVTIILLAVSAVVLIKDRSLWLEKQA